MRRAALNMSIVDAQIAITIELYWAQKHKTRQTTTMDQKNNFKSACDFIYNSCVCFFLNTNMKFSAATIQKPDANDNSCERDESVPYD